MSQQTDAVSFSSTEYFVLNLKDQYPNYTMPAEIRTCLLNEGYLNTRASISRNSVPSWKLQDSRQYGKKRHLDLTSFIFLYVNTLKISDIISELMLGHRSI